jgi:hypothetical protein
MPAEQCAIVVIANKNDHRWIRPREVIDFVCIAAKGPTGIPDREGTAANRAPPRARPPVIEGDSSHREAGVKITERAPDRPQ